jgi:hypothetical protein
MDGQEPAPSMRPRAAEQTFMTCFLPSAAVVNAPAVAGSRACAIQT